MAEFNEPLSRNEAILQNILGASNELLPPQSRVEAILQAILNNTAYTDEPQSAIEELLLAIKNSGEFTEEIQSRNEAILLAKLRGEQYTEPPQSRIEELLIQWLEATDEKTVTGSLVTITDAIANNAFSAVIAKIVSSSGVTSAKVYRVGTNLLKTKNGTLSLTGRTITINNSEVVCNCTGGSQSAVIVPSGGFDTSYYLPAGTYYFDLGLVEISGGRTFQSPYVQLYGTNGTTYEKGEGAFTLPVAARIIGIRSTNANLWAANVTYTVKPKITLAADEPFAPFSGNDYTLSWSGTAGSVTDGEINFTTGVLTVGANTYQLTPTEIKAIAGTNNIWANTGDITVKYQPVESGV